MHNTIYIDMFSTVYVLLVDIRNMFTNVKYIYFLASHRKRGLRMYGKNLQAFTYMYLHWTFSAGEHATVLMILKTEYNKPNTSK